MFHACGDRERGSVIEDGNGGVMLDMWCSKVCVVELSNRLRCRVDGVLTPRQEVKSDLPSRFALFGGREIYAIADRSLDMQITRKNHHSKVRVEA